ncbi:MAG TPA: TetR/AcrR family transcriptional regulator [Rhodopseudomonas sp.]|uniref:TetR/AcrR family transcriptional regulator n=1 Tax=Rhodopseudomonas sp. TaxID=1078 RepID=UPI002ED89B50
MSNLTSKADDILSCARSLILKGGYHNFSYADIASVVGIRKPSIHHHFPSKADLVRTLVAKYREEAAAGFAQLDRNVADPLDRLGAYLGYWERCIADASHPFCVCALLAGEIEALPEAVALEVRAHFRALSDWLSAVLECGAAQGRLRLTGTARANAEMLMATVHGAMLSARAYGNAATFGDITRPLLQRLAA